MSGKPREKPQYFFAHAVEKSHPRLQEVMNAIYQMAWGEYSHRPDIQQRIQQFMAPGVQFAWKMVDGDSDKYKDKPGCAGCMIFKYSTTLAYQVVGPDNTPIDPMWLKTGYYADVYIGAAANGQLDHTAGIYLNPLIVRLLGTAEEIHPGVQAAAVMPAAPSIGGAWMAPAQSSTPAPNLPAAVLGAPAAATATPPAVSMPPAPALPTASPISIPGFSHGGSR